MQHLCATGWDVTPHQDRMHWGMCSVTPRLYVCVRHHDCMCACLRGVHMHARKEQSYLHQRLHEPSPEVACTYS